MLVLALALQQHLGHSADQGRRAVDVLLDTRLDARSNAALLSLLLIQKRAKSLLFNVVRRCRQFKLPLLRLEFVQHLFLAGLVFGSRLAGLRVRCSLREGVVTGA